MSLEGPGKKNSYIRLDFNFYESLKKKDFFSLEFIFFFSLETHFLVPSLDCIWPNQNRHNDNNNNNPN